MKSNPFYALSASAMLLGCWLLSEALHLQAGQLGGLLLLMAVLQLYEGLLVGLGDLARAHRPRPAGRRHRARPRDACSSWTRRSSRRSA